MLTNPFYPLSKPVKPMDLFSGAKVIIIFGIKKRRNSHYTNETFRHHQTYEIYTHCKCPKKNHKTSVNVQKCLLQFDK